MNTEERQALTTLFWRYLWSSILITLSGCLGNVVDGTIVECNTAYGGSRSSTAMHKQVAEDHGFTQIADFDLMDEEGEVEWPMTGGTRLDRVIVSHFKRSAKFEMIKANARFPAILLHDEQIHISV